MKKIPIIAAFVIICVSFAAGQVSTDVLVRIVKAEDSRAYDRSLEDLIKTQNPAVQTRAVLAAGRIGDDKAVPALIDLLEKGGSDKVRAMAAFALGEIESPKAADAISTILNESYTPASVRARAVEAAGKIAAANPKDPASKKLGDAILHTLDEQNRRGVRQDRNTVILGLTAVGRATSTDAKRHRPDDSDFVTAEFLKSPNARIRADAANTLARLRATYANAALRAMLVKETDGVARSNAARALGSAADAKAFDLLLKAATEDADSRVRVSAIRSLASLKDPKAADKLLERGENLLADHKRSKFAKPVEKNELIEIATVLGRLVSGTGNEQAVKFLDELVKLDDGHTAEISVARMRVKPGDFMISPTALHTWWGLSTTAQVAAELAAVFPRTEEEKKMKAAAPVLLRRMADRLSVPYSDEDKKNVIAAPDFIKAFAQFKTKDLDAFLRSSLVHQDVFVRATVAEVMGNQPPSKENITALQQAFERAAVGDKEYDDARLAIMDALFKLDKKEAAGPLLAAFKSADYLTRKKALDLLSDKDLQKASAGVPALLEQALAKGTNHVFPYTPAYATKLGQRLSTEADYQRAVSRKNGSVKAIIKTEKGTFTIDLYPEDAPLTVDNFINLARSDYFNGVPVHRVVPNFVMQGGDPRGDGNGGPGWSIRCEINLRPYDRGAVGMALSGKDTGGSQWFVTHSPQPHLDGGYTVFGHVNEMDMKVVDNIVRGDKIISIRIVGEKAPVQLKAKPTQKAEPED